MAMWAKPAASIVVSQIADECGYAAIGTARRLDGDGIAAQVIEARILNEIM